MQIRPITPSFKGYIEVPAKRPRNEYFKPTIFNTNSITLTDGFEPELEYRVFWEMTHISSGGVSYITKIPYYILQKACILADQNKNAIVSIDSEDKISLKKFNLDQIK